MKHSITGIKHLILVKTTAYTFPAEKHVGNDCLFSNIADGNAARKISSLEEV